MTSESSQSVIDRTVIDGLRGLFDDAVEAQKFLNDLIQTYRAAGAETLVDLQATLARDDRPALSRQAHKLKGLGRNIGAVRLGQSCAALEVEAKGPVTPERVTALCQRIAADFEASCAELGHVHYRAE